MNLLASADLDWGIGNKGQLLFRVKADMQNVKNRTTGKVIVMGRGTFDSLPNGKPLPNRLNIVLTRSNLAQVALYPPEQLQIYADIPTLLQALKAFAPQDIFVFGGQSIYEQLLPYCNTAYITQFYARAPHDAALPRFDLSPAWRLSSRSERQCENGLEFSFDVYERV